MRETARYNLENYNLKDLEKFARERRKKIDKVVMWLDDCFAREKKILNRDTRGRKEYIQR
jgi:hypothetical protein